MQQRLLHVPDVALALNKAQLPVLDVPSYAVECGPPATTSILHQRKAGVHRAADGCGAGDTFEHIAVRVLFPQVVDEQDGETVVKSFREDFPEAYFFTRSGLDRALTNRDDGSALFLLQNGMRMMNAARTLYLTRVRMRNVMEVCFGNTEGMTQRERWEHTISIYPQLKGYGFSADERTCKKRGRNLKRKRTDRRGDFETHKPG